VPVRTGLGFTGIAPEVEAVVGATLVLAEVDMEDVGGELVPTTGVEGEGRGELAPTVSVVSVDEA